MAVDLAPLDQALESAHLPALSAALVVGGFGLWMTAKRPLILIAPEGEAVGLMTPAGRAVSKPAGGAFVASTWLVEDGDTATQAASAARPGWTGDQRDRQAELPHGWRILHLTGKGAGALEPRARSLLRRRHRAVAAADDLAGAGRDQRGLLARVDRR